MAMVFAAAPWVFHRARMRIFSSTSAAQETLEMLEWTRLSRDVSSFASTSLGRERLQVLELPSTRTRSEMLLSQTQAALEFEALRGSACDIGGVKSETIRIGLERASKGATLSGQEATALATMLIRARSLKSASSSCTLENKEKEDLLRPVVFMLSSIDVSSDTVRSITNIVDDEGSIRDSASPELRKARTQEQNIEQRIQGLLQRIVYEKLTDDPNGQVVKVDQRLCVALSTENATKVPGLLLRSSFGGTVCYVEPSPAVSLNNMLSQARLEVVQAEHHVLFDLTSKLQPFLHSFKVVLDTIVDFDVVMARARYSSSLGAALPELVSENSSEHNGKAERSFLVRLEGARHPLLVQQHRERIRDVKSRISAKQKVVRRMKARAYLNLVECSAEEEALLELESRFRTLEASAPVPIDFFVKAKTKVVTITGPNTGGKTAAAKTLGIAALMARAGLYVLAKEPAYLPWFDSVLADIGDQQSLSRSLSTFSGHLLRIKKIREESTRSSLVLLDEVGTGTDFVEGAALGMAILESFSERGSLLTLATTHHGELKMLKYRDSRFENASVEFDEGNLKPTYRLLWGIPGRSNALNIASRLGLPSEIVDEARRLHGAANAELNEVLMHIEQARQSFDRDFLEAQRLLKETKNRHGALLKAAEELHAFEKELSLDKSDQLAVAEAVAHSKLNKTAQDSRRK